MDNYVINCVVFLDINWIKILVLIFVYSFWFFFVELSIYVFVVWWIDNGYD